MKEDNRTFEPVDAFSWKINRSERTQQVRLLVPLLDRPDGRAWLLEGLNCPCTYDEAMAAGVFHLCFPLRDIFTKDYYQCRGTRHLEDQFIAYYNRLFDLPEGFGVEEIWRTAPGGEIRHPAAGGRKGWYEDFLKERIPDATLREKAREARRMLGTEADVFIQTQRHVIVAECKYRSQFSWEQYERQQKTGKALARRLGKAFHFGLVREKDADPAFVKIKEPYVTWDAVKEKLASI
jgi:hypothetical protein